MPDFHDLTFEQRFYLYASDDQINFINIYNDSFQFVLPLTDFYYLNLEANKYLIYPNYTGSTLGNLNLTRELTLLGSYINLETISDWQKLLDIILGFVNAKCICINEQIEYETYRLFIKEILQEKKLWGGQKNA